MSKTLKSLSCLMVLTIAFLWSGIAWAVQTPELNSGGKYFRGKGTHDVDQYLDYQDFREPAAHQYGQGVAVGPVRVQPHVDYTREWDSNVFLTENDRKSDWINRLTYGTNAELPLDAGKHTVSAGVHGVSEWFNRFDSENHTDWLVQGRGKFNFQSVTIDIRDDFQRLSGRGNNEFQERIERKENNLDAVVEIPFAQFFQETEFQYFIENFSDSTRNILDRQEFAVYPRIGINVGDRTQALAEYGYDYIRYTNNLDRNGHVNQISGGLRGYLSELVTYQAWGGWQWRNYNQDIVKDYAGFIARGEVRYDPTVNTQITMRLRRNPVETVFSGQSYYVTNAIDLVARQKIADRLFASLAGSLQYNRYSTTRHDFRTEPSIRMEYILPGDFASIFGEYSFANRLSNVVGFDYDRHRANFGVRVEV